jgi:hypothetical protein
VTEPCCELHNDRECCDPHDCGPCCENCPTCPSLRKEWLHQLTPAERKILSVAAHQQVEWQRDPRTAWPDLAQRNRARHRWQLIGDALDRVPFTPYAREVEDQIRRREFAEEGLL